jgi:membrane-bound lytic murein transglycosylase D
MPRWSYFGAGFGLSAVLLLFWAFTNAGGDSGFQSVTSPKLPDAMDVAGERVPLEIVEVRERVDREILMNTFGHSNTFQYIKLSGRFFPIIEPILARNGVPEDFKYLAVIESGLRNVASPAGAKGYWQFMKATAIQFGLEISEEVDERQDIEKSTEAACRYLLGAYKRLGSWTAAAAAYNMGEGGFSNSAKAQFSGNYYDLYLNQETSRYVPRLLAMKEIMRDPKRFGFNLDPEDHYPPYGETEVVTVDGPVPSWAVFAKEKGISLATFKFYNPWAIGYGLTNKNKKSYKVLIPKEQHRQQTTEN